MMGWDDCGGTVACGDWNGMAEAGVIMVVVIEAGNWVGSRRWGDNNGCWVG